MGYVMIFGVCFGPIIWAALAMFLFNGAWPEMETYFDMQIRWLGILGIIALLGIILGIGGRE